MKKLAIIETSSFLTLRSTQKPVNKYSFLSLNFNRTVFFFLSLSFKNCLGIKNEEHG
jgi:hypothetical protein